MKTATLCLALTFLLSPPVQSQPRLLDNFESLNGWKSVTSEGVKLTLTQEPGMTGQALAMHFNMSGVYGYVIAQKEFSFDLPPNYQFTFDMRADAPVNNFEFKVMDEHDNVWWIKKLNFAYPREWTRQRIKKRHLTFAWGPQRGEEFRKVRKVEFVVSVGTGGSGTVFIDNFRFEPIDDQEAGTARAKLGVSSAAPHATPTIDSGGTMLKGWRTSGSGAQQLTVAFGCLKEIGGLAIDWDPQDFAVAYEVLVSDDARGWTKAYSVNTGNGGRDYVYLPECEGRFLRLVLTKSSRNKGYGVRQMAFKGPQFSSSPNDLFRAIAAEAPRGSYPMYFLNRQSYWTVVGVHGDTKEALVNEQGQIEVDKGQFSLEPFLYIDGKLISWSDVTTTPGLMGDYLPLPSVTWKYGNQWELTVEPSAMGVSGKSILFARYSLKRLGSAARAKLFVAIRPFQVNPPWQFLNVEGGASRIDSIVMRNGVVYANTKTVIPMTAPSGFGATPFEGGEIVEHLSGGALPPAQGARDHLGFASAALQYDLSLAAGETRDVIIAVPFHVWEGSPTPNMGSGGAQMYHSILQRQTIREWEGRLAKIRIRVPERAQPVINTFFSNIGYIFINRDGPGIQPGSRSYERSWIRDGALTCTALLQTGHAPEVREFLDWYAQGQFPSGKVPCVIDSRGPDAVPEHDSHGEFIYAILQYFLYTKDTLWLQGKYDAVVKAVRYMQGLRRERKTDVYKNGTPEQRALYGLLPESISHEGYWDVPRHSYWDDFFALRGFKDAATIAAVLGRTGEAAEFAAERDDFRKDLYASMRLAMQNTKIEYIPGCAELGDFDATSTTIGVVPGGELGRIPEPQLHNTFDKYFAYFEERKTKEVGPNYTPYETRVIGTFVYLGQRRRAEEALDFFMHDRRPPSWNQWAEVVWRDPATPKFIGDMPHTWVGSDFIRSVRAMFVYEREQDTSLVLGAGIPESWLADTTGIDVGGLPTYYGGLSYRMQRLHDSFTVSIRGGLQIPSGGIVVTSPIAAPAKRVTVNGTPVIPSATQEVIVRELPATVFREY
jgi:hypothetical protein